MKTFSVVLLLVVVAFSSSVRAAEPPSALLEALKIQESGNNDQAIGDKKLADHAYGCLQIRQPVVDDVNRQCGTQYEASDCLGNKELSEWICRHYIGMYATEENVGRSPTLEDMARIWNGGPKGFKRRSTLVYWHHVEDILRKL